MGEFSDLGRRPRGGVLAELRGLSRAAKLAIAGAVLAVVLLLAALTSGAEPTTATARAAGSSPLPMTPTGGYTVGQQYYADKIPMPNYVGWTLQAAVNDLAARGITVRAMDPSATQAVILEQNPYPGTRIGQSTANSIQLMVGVRAPSTTTTTTPPPPTTEAPSNTDVHVDVDEHHNLPDGALTGGYCRRKWWC